MSEDIGQFEVPVKDFMVVEMSEAVDDLTEDLHCFLLSQEPPLLDVGVEVALVAVLEHEVVVVGCLLHVVQLDDVVALATLEHLDLAFQEFLELACMGGRVPLTFSRRMDLTAISLLVALS